MPLRWIVETEVEPARALATGALLLDAVADPSSQAALLYGARVSGEAVALGLWQRATDALHVEAARAAGVQVLRRSTGGPMARLGEGVLYVALCLRHASVLMSCPPERVLNRNVRGILGGLSLSGTPAHYFGREWVSVARQPAALVGWDRHADGRVLLEFFIAHTKPFTPAASLDAYPEHSAERYLGKEPVTLFGAWEREHEVEQIVRWIAEGHVSRCNTELSLDRSSLTDDERKMARTRADRFLLQPDPEEGALRWSRPREIPIGWLSAGARLDDAGRLADVRIAGDFYQDHDAPRVLRDKLVGQVPTPELVADAINTTWDGQNLFIEGVKSLDPLLDAILEAAT